MRRTFFCWLILAAACSDRPARERPRADVPAVQVVASPDAMPLVDVVAKEPNDDKATATALAVGEQATDTIGAAGDVDVFALALERARTLRIMLASPDDADVLLELADESGALIAVSDRGPAGVVEGLPNISLAAGRYTLTVREFIKKPAKQPKAKAAKPAKSSKSGAKAAAEANAPVADGHARTTASGPYTLGIAEVTTTLEDEREPNDEIATAGQLALAETRKGFIGWRGDVDVWQLGMEGLGEQNVLDIQVHAASGTNTVVELVAASGEVLASRKATQAGLLVMRGLVPPAEGAWIRLAGTPSNPQLAYEVQFGARYETTPASGMAPDALEAGGAIAEREPNDNASQATALSAAGMTASLDLGDTDMFAVPAAAEAREFIVIPSDGLDLIVEEIAAGRVVQTANLTALGGSERLSLTPAATVVRVRAHKRRGEITVTGSESQYQVQLLGVTSAANEAAVEAAPVERPQ